MQEARYNTESTLLIFPRDLSGTPVTGLTESEIAVYVCYVGGSSTLVVEGDTTLVEVSSSNQPGWYFLTLAVGTFSALGTMAVTVKQKGTGIFTTWNDDVFVVANYREETLRRLIGLSKENQRLTVTAVNAFGFMTEGTLEIFDNSGLTESITSYAVAATYNPISGILQSHTISEN